MKSLIFYLVVISIVTMVSADSVKFSVPDDLNKKWDFSNEEWQMVANRMALLNNISYLPSLLPVIMKNREALGLTGKQVRTLRDWRKKNYQKMVSIMNTIISKRIVLSQQAVNPTISQSQLIHLQDELFKLHREVFLIRLSCRELVTNSFSEEQWENFEFIAADDPKIAGLLGQ